MTIRIFCNFVILFFYLAQQPVPVRSDLSQQQRGSHCDVPLQAGPGFQRLLWIIGGRVHPRQFCNHLRTAR